MAQGGERRPRVLMVTGAYHPEISSSALQCREMARLLAGRIHIHVLTTAVDATLRRDDSIDGVRVTRIFIDVRSMASKVRAALTMASALLRLIADHDVVHLHGFSTKNVLVTAVAKLLRKPVILSLHTAGFDEAATIRRQGRLSWWAFANADRYLSVSRGLIDAYLAAGLPAERVQLAPNGIDIERFSPASESTRQALRAKLGLPVDQPVILFVGFFSRDKQPQILFEAWSRLRDRGMMTTLVFVGATRSRYFEVDEELSRAMREQASRIAARDDLVFTGATERVEDYFQTANVFALPSRREGLPVALLEAMACQLPCVASRLPGSTDTIIEHKINGLLVPAGDVMALTHALDQILRDPPLAWKLGTAARETIVRRFSNTDTASQWLRTYHQVSGARQG